MRPSERCRTPSIIVWKVKYPLRFFVYCFQLITQQYKPRPSRKAPHVYSHYEKFGRFPLCMQKKTSRATTKLALFTVSEDEWNTKEDTG